MKVKLSQIKIKPGPAPFHASTGFEDLAESMDNFGLQEPIIVTRDYNIIHGNRRFLAAKFLGWKEIEAIFQEESLEKIHFDFIESNSKKLNRTSEALNDIQRLYRHYKNAFPTENEELQRSLGKIPADHFTTFEAWYW